MKAPFTPNHPEQVAYEQTCSMWLTDGTSDREKYAYRDGHHAGWRNATEGLEEICAALRLAIADKRAFAICVEGRNGATMTLHNCDDDTIAARMLERFARQQRSGADPCSTTKRRRSHVCPVCAASMVESDEALMRQALEALQFSSEYLDELGAKLFPRTKKAKPGSTAWHVQKAMAALRGRLDDA